MIKYITWQFHPSLTVKNTWRMVKTQGNPPLSLGNTFSQLGQTVYVFGGFLNGQVINDTYMLHLEALIWTQLKPSGIPPAPRCICSHVMYRHGTRVKLTKIKDSNLISVINEVVYHWPQHYLNHLWSVRQKRWLHQVNTMSVQRAMPVRQK